jgi:hypothetical protein
MVDPKVMTVIIVVFLFFAYDLRMNNRSKETRVHVKIFICMTRQGMTFCFRGMHIIFSTSFF